MNCPLQQIFIQKIYKYKKNKTRTKPVISSNSKTQQNQEKCTNLAANSFALGVFDVDAGVAETVANTVLGKDAFVVAVVVVVVVDFVAVLTAAVVVVLASAGSSLRRVGSGAGGDGDDSVVGDDDGDGNVDDDDAAETVADARLFRSLMTLKCCMRDCLTKCIMSSNLCCNFLRSAASCSSSSANNRFHSKDKNVPKKKNEKTKRKSTTKNLDSSPCEWNLMSVSPIAIAPTQLGAR